VVLSKFTETMYGSAHSRSKGLVTGEPDCPLRHTWGEVHERARRIASGLATAGVGRGDAVAVLAGAPAEIAPAGQGVWMRGASLTMLHQPTPRTDLQRWSEETTAVIKMIGAKTVVISDPFMAAAPLLSQLGLRVLIMEQLLDSRPIDPVETDDDDIALLQLTSGSTGSPKAVQITHRNVVSNAEAMFIGANVDIDNDVIVSWLPLFHDMGMTGFLTVPMFFGVELIKVTPVDFLRDTLLWAKLIDKYKGTMTAAPNFAYTLFAKRLRKLAQPGQFDLSSLRWALSGAEHVEPADVEDLCEAGRPFGLRPEAILPAYGMAETTVAVSFTECGAGLVVDEVDADLLAMLHRAVPTTKGKTRRLATLGRLLNGLEARIVDQDDNILPARGVGVIQVRGEPVTLGYTTMAGFVAAQDDQGWYDTGDLGYLRLRPSQGRDHHGRAKHLPDRHRTRRDACFRGPPRLHRGSAPGRWTSAGDVRRRRGVQQLARRRRRASYRASGSPRGGCRGRCPAAQRGCARAGNDPQDAVGEAAAGPHPGARRLTFSGANRE
jgi:fatty-acyl-CoA synthase